MGLAASQARLLLLTARKSDLEYRAQMICQRKVMLAMQTEELALNYSNALNNRKLFFSYKADTNEGVTKQEVLTYDNFTAMGNSTRYRLVVGQGENAGKIACRDIETEFAKYGFSTVEAAREAMVEVPALKNEEYLQDLIQSGRLLIQEQSFGEPQEQTVTEEVIDEETGEVKLDKDGNPVTKEVKKTVQEENWNTVALSGMSDVASRLDDTDDASASAEYEYKSLIIQNQDKQLDVELKQVETQQKACENEIDSVKKILDKNIEKSFKTFA